MSDTGLIQFSEAQVWAIGLACVLMLMDFVTGFVGAVVRGDVSSSKMREGLGHKALLLCVIALAVIVEAGAQHVAGLGFGGVTVTVVCAYIAVMEVASCMENVCAAYPELRDTPLMRVFKHDEGGED
ncbi:phage holin family protein [uncultured Parolsenella sp.]|uniref:phage holin family protein n=1 Tax=uncultured Parolsenella sp. TaxID=2083008 RepID=UPI0025CC3037|nr:phage holin family protein [uncultured Parolsenella sp.]